MGKDPYKSLADSLWTASASPFTKDYFRTLPNSLTAWGDEKFTPKLVYQTQSPVPPMQFMAGPPPTDGGEGTVPEVSLQSAYFQYSLDTATKDLRELRFDLRERSNRAFYVALSLGIVGGICIVVGLGYIFAKTFPVGIAGSIGGALSGYFSKVFYSIYKLENDNVSNIMKDLRRIEETRLGLWLADNIADPVKRDEAINKLMDKIKAG